MDILIMRHGDAVEDAPGLGDGGRWLTGKGRKLTRGVAGWLCAHDAWRPLEVWTSPLVRAVQTAEIVAESVGLTDEVSVLAALATSGDPDDVLTALSRHHGSGPVLLVGHEPSLSHLAINLLGRGVHWPGFKKSGVLALHWKHKHAHADFAWVLDPKTLEKQTDPARLG